MRKEDRKQCWTKQDNGEKDMAINVKYRDW
jgi:hypothetical protein